MKIDPQNRAVALQAALEEALGFDADSEIMGGVDVFDGDEGPVPVVTLTEAAAERVLELVSGRK